MHEFDHKNVLEEIHIGFFVSIVFFLHCITIVSLSGNRARLDLYIRLDCKKIRSAGNMSYVDPDAGPMWCTGGGIVVGTQTDGPLSKVKF